MGKSFFPDDVNQFLLFPPSLDDWLPEGHLARFLVDVVSALDLSAIYASDGRGQSEYAPATSPTLTAASCRTEPVFGQIKEQRGFRRFS